MALRNRDYSDLEELYHEETLEEQFRYKIREEELKEKQKMSLDAQEKEKEERKDKRSSGIDIVYKGDWDVITPWQLIITGEALSHGAIRLWLALRYHARKDGEVRECFPSIARLTDFMGISETQISAYIKELKEVGLIEVRRKQRLVGLGVMNIYTMLDPKKWWKDRGLKLKKQKIEEKRKKYQFSRENIKKT